MQLFQKTVGYTGYISKMRCFFDRNKIKISVSRLYKKEGNKYILSWIP